MTKFREKAERRTIQVVGEMISDDKLVQEGKEHVRQAEQEAESASGSEPAPKTPAVKTPAAKAPAPRRTASGSSR